MVGADPFPIRYALASDGQWSSFTKCEIFRGQRCLSPEIWASEKVDFEWVENGPISPFVDQSSPNLVNIYGSDRSMQPLFPVDDILLQSGDICNEVTKWRSWKLRFSPPKFLGRRTPKSDADILCPKGDTSSRKVWRNSPNRTRRYQPMYTRFLPNFWISGVKKLLGADPSAMTCALASVGHFLPIVEIFRGQRPITPEIWAEIWASEKVDWVGRNERPIFRRLWTKVHQIWYARRGMIAVFNAVFRSTISCSRPEIFAMKSQNPKFWCFWAAKFFWGGSPNFWLTFKNYSHQRTCGKVWWRSAQRPPRLDGEK